MTEQLLLRYRPNDCSIARAMTLLGERWTILVLRAAFSGVRRFDDIQENTGAPRDALSRRLGELVEHEILRRVPYQEPGQRQRYEYRLTDKGRDAYPILAAMAAWGERWLTGPEGTPLVLHHTECGHDMRAVVVCSECAQPLDVRQVRAKTGPGFPASGAQVATAAQPPPRRV